MHFDHGSTEVLLGNTRSTIVTPDAWKDLIYMQSESLSNQYILISIVHILVMPGIHMSLVGPGFPVEYRRGGAEPADGAPACNQLYQSLPQGEAINQFNLFIRIFCSRRLL